MQRKTTFRIIILLVIALLVGVAIYGVYRHYSAASQPVEATVEALGEEQHTHAIVFFEEEVDPLMLGKWQHTVDTAWYRVYTTEPAEDGFCWGREWNEAEDIFEEDLMPYGNGWFKWKKTDKYVLEWHVTDNRGAAIPYEYTIIDLNEQELYFKETRDAQKQRFRKCEW